MPRLFMIIEMRSQVEADYGAQLALKAGLAKKNIMLELTQKLYEQTKVSAQAAYTAGVDLSFQIGEATITFIGRSNGNVRFDANLDGEGYTNSTRLKTQSLIHAYDASIGSSDEASKECDSCPFVLVANRDPKFDADGSVRLYLPQLIEDPCNVVSAAKANIDAVQIATVVELRQSGYESLTSDGHYINLEDENIICTELPEYTRTVSECTEVGNTFIYNSKGDSVVIFNRPNELCDYISYQHEAYPAYTITRGLLEAEAASKANEDCLDWHVSRVAMSGLHISNEDKIYSPEAL